MTEAAWPTASLADLVDYTIGGLWGNPHGHGEPDETDVLVVRGADFRNWDLRHAADAAPRRIPTRFLERRRLESGDLVLEVSGGSPAQPVGRVILIDDKTASGSDLPLICSNFCRKLHLKPGTNALFVKRQLDWLYRSGHANQFQTSTTNIRNLQVDEFLQGTILVLPDRQLQDELTVLLDQAASRRSSAASHLVALHVAVERFRQAVLDAACSGRLTSEWRELHQDDAHALAKSLRGSSAKHRGLKAQPHPQPELMDVCPSSWEVITLSIAIDRIEAGKSFGTLGRAATADEWGIIKVSAMSWGSFLPDENKAIDANQANPQYEIHSGDLLISRANTRELVGATVLVNETRPRLLLSDKSLRLVPREAISKPWLNYILRSRLVRHQFSDQATGTSDSMRNLSQAKILATTIPLPPTSEQVEIAERVHRLFSLADSVQRHIELTSRAVGRSSQAILTKAFSGELMPAGDMA